MGVLNEKRCKNYKELNGTLAEVLNYDEVNDRFVVRLCNMTKTKIKVENAIDIEERHSTRNTSTEFHIGKAPLRNKI